MKRPFVLFFVFLISVLFLNTYAFAANVEVSSVTKLNTDKQIVGQKAVYTLDVPPSWKSYVEVYRDDIIHSAEYIEKLTFYYVPISVNTASEELIEIFVYEKEDWDDSPTDFVKLAESNKYVMAYRLQKTNPFVFGSDRLIYDGLIEDIVTPSFFKDYISFPLDSDDFIKNIVTVNGKRISSRVYTNSLRVVHVPLREICEILGYSVNWDAKDSTVSISNQTFFMYLGYNLSSNKRFNLININGKSYISTMFFLQILKCNVEIDGNNNVKIFGSVS